MRGGKVQIIGMRAGDAKQRESMVPGDAEGQRTRGLLLDSCSQGTESTQGSARRGSLKQMTQSVLNERGNLCLIG